LGAVQQSGGYMPQAHTQRKNMVATQYNSEYNVR